MKKLMITGFLLGIMSFSGNNILKENEFREQTQKNSIIMSESQRKIKINGLDNMRDIGGYITKDGKKVKRGVLYRSDSLSKMTKKGQKDFENLNIQYIFDLRDDGEVAKASDPVFIKSKYMHTEIPTSGVAAKKPATTKEIQDFYSNPETLNYWLNGYEYMVGSAKARESLKTILLNSIESKGEKGIIWHCSGGKDRTGFISVIFLSLLGVDNETIINDYLLTNDYRRKFDEKELEDMRKIFNNDLVMEKGFLSIQQAKPEYVKVFLDKIQRLYGTTDNYLIKEAGLTQAQIDEIKTIYTE